MGCRNKCTHTQTNTRSVGSSKSATFSSSISLIHTIPTIFSTRLNTSAIIHRAHTPMNQPGTLLHLALSFSVILLVHLPLHSLHCTIRCTLDKPIWLFSPPAFIYMQLSTKTNSRQCTADCISVSPPRSYYTAHELWIVVGLRWGSAGNHKGQSP